MVLAPRACQGNRSVLPRTHSARDALLTSAERPSVMAMLEPRVSAWMKERGIEGYVGAAESYAVAVAPTRSELARREAVFGPQSPQLFPALINLAGNPVVESEESLPLLARAEAIVRANNGPAALLAAIAIQRSKVRYSNKSAGDRSLSARSAELLLTASRDVTIEGDAPSLSAIRIAAADEFGEARKPGQALPLLRQVASDARLDPRDPLRIGAPIRIAAIEVAAGDLAEARTVFEQTGLSSSQYALVDATPTLVRSNASSNDFPMEAMRWGFEGWAVTEFDITADGRTVGVRPVMAYPPFVFGAAAQGILNKGAVYPKLSARWRAWLRRPASNRAIQFAKLAARSGRMRAVRS